MNSFLDKAHFAIISRGVHGLGRAGPRHIQARPDLSSISLSPAQVWLGWKCLAWARPTSNIWGPSPPIKLIGPGQFHSFSSSHLSPLTFPLSSSFPSYLSPPAISLPLPWDLSPVSMAYSSLHYNILIADEKTTKIEKTLKWASFLSSLEVAILQDLATHFHCSNRPAIFFGLFVSCKSNPLFPLRGCDPTTTLSLSPRETERTMTINYKQLVSYASFIINAYGYSCTLQPKEKCSCTPLLFGPSLGLPTI